MKWELAYGKGLSNGYMPYHIDVTVNIGLRICLMRVFFGKDGHRLYLLPQCSIAGNLNLLMGIHKEGCEVRKEKKKIQSQ